MAIHCMSNELVKLDSSLNYELDCSLDVMSPIIG